jgi:hypothetical protein
MAGGSTVDKTVRSAEAQESEGGNAILQDFVLTLEFEILRLDCVTRFTARKTATP